MVALQLLASCAQVQIKDQEWCADNGTLGAHCAHTLSTATRDIPQPDWDNLRFGQICTIDPPDKLGSTLAEIKKEIEELCSLHNVCTYEDVKAVRRFLDSAIGIQNKIQTR